MFLGAGDQRINNSPKKRKRKPTAFPVAAVRLSFILSPSIAITGVHTPQILHWNESHELRPDSTLPTMLFHPSLLLVIILPLVSGPSLSPPLCSQLTDPPPPPNIAQVSTIFWPINYPNATSPWVIGAKNYVSWQTGGGTGIASFDIQLHNSNRSLMVGFIPIALRVPLIRVPTGRKNYGGELEVDLSTGVPEG